MIEIEEIAGLEFPESEVKLPPISPGEWQERADDEFNNYQFLVPIVNMDSVDALAQVIEESGDPEQFQRLYESFDELSGRMEAFHELLKTGSARLLIALARVALAKEARS